MAIPLADKTTKDREDLVSAAARASSAAATVSSMAKMIARAAAVLSAAAAVTARVAEAMEDRQIAPETSSQIRALLQMHLPKILRRSEKKKRDASVRRKISATAKI